MARGWESKSVESQMESAREGGSKPRRQLTQEQQKAAQERQGLELSRADLIRRIAASTSPRYAQLLQQALKEVEEKLARTECV
jgi:hypothetical protein